MATKQSNVDRGTSLLATDMALAYKPPRSSLHRFFWKKRMWFEATFALSMCEGWEKILVVMLVAIFCGLLVTGVFRYLPILPYHLQFLYQRTTYYLSGTEQLSVRGVETAMLSGKTSYMHTAEL